MSISKRIALIGLLIVGFLGGSAQIAAAQYFPAPSAAIGSGCSRVNNVTLPIDYRSDRTYPLIVVLHSYGSTGAAVLANLVLSRLANFDDGYIVWAPAGLTDGSSLRWNHWTAPTGNCATNDFDYVSSGITEIKGRFTVSWVGGLGYSNGGLMILQLSQQYPGIFHTMAVLAAAGGDNDSSAAQSVATPLLLVIGSTDATVPPAGQVPATSLPGTLNSHGGVGSTGLMSATATITAQAGRNGVTGSLGSAGTAFDLASTGTPTGTGAECTAQIYSGTTSQSAIELWTENAVGHSGVATFTSSTLRGSFPFFVWMIANHRAP